ncbi:uncharacterized protein LOC103314747 [Tribolium castaneum]|nr:PREDICTED: uncharacterized protein LOC103314747 isoform X2 [Tribolium castaneum]|eukprot:XP_015837486.1 PREDICTED: uncharacterized protein LOC103314747 isoform X2 [Tribolium castaneum]
MVKYAVSKAKMFTSKNLSGIETVLKVDKQGKSVIITLEQKVSSLVYKGAVYVIGAVLALVAVYLFLVRNVDVIKYLTAIFLIILSYQFLGVVYEESLVMVHSLGYQVTSKSLVGQTDLFIPWNQVQSIFINEVIVRHKVIHLLTILTKEKGKEKLIPLFLDLQPRLKHLEIICKHLKSPSS